MEQGVLKEVESEFEPEYLEKFWKKFKHPFSRVILELPKRSPERDEKIRKILDDLPEEMSKQVDMTRNKEGQEFIHIPREAFCSFPTREETDIARWIYYVGTPANSFLRKKGILTSKKISSHEYAHELCNIAMYQIGTLSNCWKSSRR